MTITPFAFEVQPLSPPDLLDTITHVMNINRCVGYCHQQRLCRFIDYDLTTGVCRIFSSGAVVSSSRMTSQAGTVYDAPSLYASYGQPCTSNTCQVNRYLICGVGNTCQCPPGFVWIISECVGKASFFTCYFSGEKRFHQRHLNAAVSSECFPDTSLVVTLLRIESF